MSKIAASGIENLEIFFEIIAFPAFGHLIVEHLFHPEVQTHIQNSLKLKKLD